MKTTQIKFNRATSILRELIRLDMVGLNFLADLYDTEFTVDVDTDGYLCLFKCRYSPTNSFPKIEVFERLCKASDPLYMAVIPLEFAVDRARRTLS